MPPIEQSANVVAKDQKHESGYQSEKTSQLQGQLFFNERGELPEAEKTSLDLDIGEIDSLAINERFREFKVSKPTLIGGKAMYEVAGYTKDGPFNVMKRYSDFDQLRTCLVKRWPGFYIPALPPKKAVVSYFSCLITCRTTQRNHSLSSVHGAWTHSLRVSASIRSCLSHLSSCYSYVSRRTLSRIKLMFCLNSRRSKFLRSTKLLCELIWKRQTLTRLGDAPKWLRSLITSARQLWVI